MFDPSRRRFLRSSTLGLAAAGAAGWTLSAQARPTPQSGSEEEADAVLGGDMPKPFAPTEDNILGPYHRPGAPFRGKVTPPLEPGQVLLISGRVWGFDTKKPLAGAVLDIWQANAEGRYDNDDPANPPKANVFKNRVRLVSDDAGYYEYETIIPGEYQIGPDAWRPKHIHYLVQQAGYKRLITQLYFKGAKHNDADSFIKPSLIIELAENKTPHGVYHSGQFDIVLAK